MARPDLTEIREWIDIAVGQLSDAQLTRVIGAETVQQDRQCRVPLNAEDYPDDLAQALMRRVARAVALRGIPLGATGAEGTPSTSGVAGLDREIQRYEGPYRRLTAG